MPIRQERKHLYPANWRSEIVPAVARRSGGVCERCGVRNYAVGGRSPAGVFHLARPIEQTSLRLVYPKPDGAMAMCHGYDLPLRIFRIVLTVAHLNHDETDCRMENLAHLCQRCHNRHDAPHRAAGRKLRNEAAQLL